MLNLFLSIESTINDTVLGLPRQWLTHTMQTWLRPLFVVGVLLLSAAIGLFASPDELKLVPVAVMGIATVLFFLRWPPLGLVALMITIAIPINGPSGANATLALTALLLGLWFFDMLTRQKKLRLIPSWSIWSLLVLLLGACLSFGLGQLPWYTFAQTAPLGAQAGGLAIYILSAGAFLVTAHQVRDMRWLQAITWTFLGVGAVYVIGQNFPPTRSITWRFYGLVANGSLFWTWMVVLAFSQGVFNRKLHPAWRLALIGLVFLTLNVAFLERNDWKSGWVPPLLSIAAMLGFRFWRFGIFLAPFSILPASYLASKLISSDQYSYSTRVEAWLIVVEITKANPILGLGFANYNWFTPLFPIRGYSVRFNSHSQIVDIIAQTGLVGLASFLWFFGAITRLGWRLRENVQDGFAYAYVYGALGGIAGTLVAALLGDWVLPFFYNVGLSGFRASVLSWVFLGGLVAVEQMVLNSERAEVVR